MNEATETGTNGSPRRILRPKQSRGSGWSPERRAKFEATMAAKRGTDSQESLYTQDTPQEEAPTRKRTVKRSTVPAETIKLATDHLKDARAVINARITEGATKISEEGLHLLLALQVLGG